MAGRDERGVAPVIGFILVFSFLILAFTIYQGALVPDQNRQAEFEHSQMVQGQMQDLRNAIMSAATGGTERTVSVKLGAEYPRRTLARNLGYSGGSLQTRTFPDGDGITLANATAIDRFGETADYWNGTSRHFRTTALVYEPVYSFYSDAPTTWYANTLVYNTFDSANLSLTPQSIIEGNRITLVSVDGNLSRSGSGTVSVDPGAISTSTTRVSIKNGTDPISVTIPTRLPVDWWRETLADETTSADGHVAAVRSSGENKVTIVLESDTTYTLRMAKIGVGTGVREEPATYLTLVNRPSGTVFNDTSHSITLEARDRYNNPVGGVQVNGTVFGSGNVVDSTVETDSLGRATFEYVAGNSGSANLSFNISTADSTSYEEVWVNLSVKAPAGEGNDDNDGSGAYTMSWYDPNKLGTGLNTDGALSHCSDSGCIYDASRDGGENNVTLRAFSNLNAEGLNVDFAVNNSSIAQTYPGEITTDSTGNVTTILNTTAPGAIAVYVASGGSADLFNMTITSTPIVDAGGPYSVSEGGAPIPLDGSGSTDHLESLSYDWQITNDPTGGASLSDQNAEIASFDPPSDVSSEHAVSVELTVTDGEGNVNTTATTVTVEDTSASRPSLSSKIVDQGQVGALARYEVSYDISNRNNFDSVEVSILNLDSNGANESYTSTNPRTNLDNYGWTDTYGGTGGDEYLIRINVINDSGFIVDSRSVTDIADGTDPTGNNELREADSPLLTNSNLIDNSANSNANYDLSYTVSDSAGTFTETEVLFTNLDTSSATRQKTAMGLSDSVSYSAGGVEGDQYRIAVQVHDDDGIVVAQRVLTDTADGGVTNAPPTGSFTYSPGDPEPGETIVFDASGSTDPDANTLTYRWDWTSDGTIDATSTDPDTNMDYAFNNAGSYPVSLNVSDGKGGWNVTTETVTVSSPTNTVPAAEANGPYEVNESDTIGLSAAGSADPDGSIASYSWTITSDPTGEVSLSDNDSASPTFNASVDVDSNTTVTVRLEVTDDDGATATDTATVTVLETDPPTSGELVEPVSGSASVFWGGPGVSFDVQNTGGAPATVVAITVNSTSNPQAVSVSESQTGSYSLGQHEVYAVASTDGVLDLGGEPYWSDGGTPLQIGNSAEMTEDGVINSGSTATLHVYAFRDSGGSTVDMAGSTVTVTLHFSDGSHHSFTVNPT